MYMNSVNIVGRLVAVPIFTKGDKPDGSNDRAWGRIACNRPGSKEADFIPFVCWGATARALAQYGLKGKELGLEGRLTTRSTPKEDGTYDNYAEINCRSVSYGADAKNTAVDAPAAAAAPVPQQGGDLAAQLAAMMVKLAGLQTQGADASEASSDNPFA